MNVMVKELFCYDCNRAANTECVEQKHRMNTEEVGRMSIDRRRPPRPHTATPWRYQGWDDTPGDRGAYILGGGPENSPDEYMVGAALPLPITNRVECEANARFIVRAVNSHESLLNAAKTVLAAFNAQIRASVRENRELPVLTGIAALHEAICLAEKEI